MDEKWKRWNWRVDCELQESLRVAGGWKRASDSAAGMPDELMGDYIIIYMCNAEINGRKIESASEAFGYLHRPTQFHSRVLVMAAG